MTEISIPEGKLPLLYLVICILAFGLLIPFLGYYWDDWMTLYFMNTSTSPADFISVDRPLQALLNMLEFRIFGLSPLGWHIFSLILRWGAVVLVWLTIRRLFPSAREFANWVTVLFAIYPSFLQQSSPLVYRQQWTTYIFYLLSTLLMLAAIEQKGSRKLLLFSLSLGSMLSGLLTTEYLVGLEMLRPIMLWITLRNKEGDWREKVRAVFSLWWPYLLLGAGYIVWRLFLLQQPEDPNPPVLIYQLLADPLGSLFGLLQAVAQDIAAILWSAWADLISPEIINFASGSEVLIWILALLLIPVLFSLFSRVKYESTYGIPKRLSLAILILGAAGLFLGLITIWIIGEQVSVGAFSDRLSIPAMLGASILVSYVVFAFVPKPASRTLVLAILVSLAIGGHLRQANLYRFNWKTQKDIAWQFHWRAPSLQPGTLVIGEGALANYVDKYNAAFALNLWYGQNKNARQPVYWHESFFPRLQNATANNLAKGITINVEFYGLTYTGNTRQAVIAYNPPESPCWWFLTPEDVNNQAIKPEFAAAAQYTNLGAIVPEADQGAKALTEIFGPKPDGGWCEVFQKASLAKQVGDWQTILTLWDDAQDRGLQPADGYELLPFIEAFAFSGDWNAAAKLSLQAYQISPFSQSMICADWEQFSTTFRNNAERELANEIIENSLGCSSE